MFFIEPDCTQAWPQEEGRRAGALRLRLYSWFRHVQALPIRMRSEGMADTQVEGGVAGTGISCGIDGQGAAIVIENSAVGGVQIGPLREEKGRLRFVRIKNIPGKPFGGTVVTMPNVIGIKRMKFSDT